MSPWIVRIAVTLVVVLGGAWLVSATEWADTEVKTPARNEAKTNPHYATQRLMRELGAKVVKRESLDAMPPAQARLVLGSSHWDLFPERARRLHDWVLQGGHLVIPAYLARDEGMAKWLPLVEEEERHRKAEADDEAPAPKKPPPPRARRERFKPVADADCHAVTEPDTLPASFGNTRAYRVCEAWAGTRYVPDKAQPALWSALSADGVDAVRVRVGQGSVTVMPWSVLSNRALPRADNALFTVAALQARAGSEIWFVAEEAREPFLLWIWNKGWAAWAVGLLALTLALWRGAVRFGPLAPVAGTQRRSMAEQVRGTAGFLHMHGGSALHAAQLRALHEAATRQLRRYGALDAPARAAAIARASGLDTASLGRAMDTRERNPAVLATDLELLETARRRLAAVAPHSSPSTS